MKEREVETYFKDETRLAGMRPYKFVSPARRSVPDQILLREIAPEHRAIVAQYMRFVELKRPGEKPTKSQEREHERLRALGFTVEVLDDKAKIDMLVLGMR